MSIGQTLKNYRRQLGLTQTDMCKDILSVSYYSKIERDERRISAEDLFDVLKKHQISITDFYQALASGSQNKDFQMFNSYLVRSLYQSDSTSIEKLLKDIPSNSALSKFEQQLVIALGSIFLHKLSPKTHSLEQTDLDFLKGTFFEVEDWNAFQFTLYTNIVEFYDLHSNHTIIYSILKKDLHAQEDQTQTLILNILINFITQCVHEKSLHLAQHYTSLLRTIPTTVYNTLQKNILYYFDLLFRYLENQDTTIKNNMNQIIELLKELDFNLYQSLLELLNKSEKIYL